MLVDERGRTEEIGAVHLAAQPFSKGPGHFFDFLGQGLPEFFVEGPGGTHQLDRTGQLALLPLAVHHTHRKHKGVFRVVLPAHQLLEPHDYGGRRCQGIRPLFRGVRRGRFPGKSNGEPSLQAIRSPSSRLAVPASSKAQMCMPKMAST